MKKLILFFILLFQVSTAFSGALKYIGSTPENDGYVSSFEDIILRFDLSDVISESGEGEWGVCVMGTYAAALPARQKSAQLFLGEDITSEPLLRLASTFKPQSEQFMVGNELHLSFPGIEVIPNQVYTLKVTFDCYAGKKGETTWDTSTKFTFYDNPLILKFIGDDNGNIVLKCESSSLNESAELEYLSSIKCNFNHDIDILDNFQAQIIEGSEVISSAESYSVDASDSKSIVINFTDNTLYKGHNYSVEIPEGCISVAGESDILNSAISIPLKGAAYKHYGAKSILPRPGTKSLLEEVQISFDVPQGAGLVYVSDDTVYPLSIYKVNDDGEDKFLQTINGVYLNDQTLKFNPTCDLDAESRYKFVMEEDVFKAYEIGAIVPKRLEEYLCDRIEFVCATPDRDDIPPVRCLPLSTEELTMARLVSEFHLPMEKYEAMEETYQFATVGDTSLPLIMSDGQTSTEIGKISVHQASFKLEEPYLRLVFWKPNGATSIQDLDLELEEGKTYSLTIPAGLFAAEQPLLKKYSGNEEVTYVFHGTTPSSHVVTINGSEGHATKLKAKRHQDMEVEFSAPENRNIEKVSYQEADNDTIDITEEVKSGSYLLTDICNDAQFYVTLDKATPVAPDYVNVSLTVGHKDNHSVVYSHPTVKSQAACVNVAGANGWSLESLTLNDEDVDIDDVKDGVYTIPAESLDKDAALNAVFAYSEKPMFDFTTGVETVEGCDYRVYSEDSGTLVIENIPANTMVSVYSTAGLHIVSENSGNGDIARIPLAPGIYVVVIGQDALKIKH